MNPQPVSLADELRKLAAQITQDLQGDGFFKPMNASYVLGRIEGRLISALLAKYAVAEPQRQCWYSDNVVCPYSNQRDDKPAVLIPAHAAEQPKLTGHQLRKASEDAALERGCMDMPEDFFERVAIRVNRPAHLPGSAPAAAKGEKVMRDLLVDARGIVDKLPVYFGIRREEAAKIIADELAGERERAAIVAERCAHWYEGRNDMAQCIADEIRALAPPVAPGEQPPRCGVVGNTEAGKMTCELSKGHEGYHSQGTVHWLGYFLPPAPPAQERVSHHFIQGFLWAECSCGWRSVICAQQECNELFAEHLAVQPSPQKEKS